MLFYRILRSTIEQKSGNMSWKKLICLKFFEENFQNIFILYKNMESALEKIL